MESLRQLGLFSLAERRLDRELIATYTSFKRSYKDNSAKLFSAVEDKNKGLMAANGVERLAFDISLPGKFFLALSPFPREALGCRAPGICKTQLDKAVADLISCWLWDIGLQTSRCPFQPRFLSSPPLSVKVVAYHITWCLAFSLPFP